MAAMTVTAVVVAAGPGSRLGAGQPKAFVDLAGVPLFVRALQAVAVPSVSDAVIVVPPGSTERAATLLARHASPCPVRVVEGGAERQDSVRSGLDAVTGAELVLIHDSARPFVSEEVVEAAIEAASRHGAAIVAVPATDTIKHVHPDGWIESTPPRDRLWLAQTPQIFRTETIRAAHARSASGPATDDAVLVEALGTRVHVVRGNPENRKITTPDDLRWATWLLAHRAGSR
jgi:2-C-methyl-D-erythritol 4-phosphate cytidylyltransferase